MELIELLKEKKIRFEKTDKRLVVFDNVYLSNSELKEFPKCSIVFFGRVDLGYTPIKELPDYSMVFFGDVYLNHTQIKKLTDCPMIFNGNLNISHTQIKELPDNIIVKCYLGIDGTSITKIPRNLIAYRIYTPVKSKFLIYIQKDGKIGINFKKKSLEEWIEIFKERKLCDYFRILTPEEYDIVEEDFKTAVKILKTWRS